ncbi:MAG: transposase zinc-binding domain-containing protein [Lewinellaceae bacterium]|nr:transposase zinc-binding domain-containing protein [Lewinellaceae bacterium]
MIRSIRASAVKLRRELSRKLSRTVCRTPALGGKRITCQGCGQVRYQYLSCGNSQCPQCQPCGITALKPPCTNSTGPGHQAPTVARQVALPHVASALLPHHFYSAA